MVAYSPIVHAERNYHTRSILRRRRWREWLNNLLPILASAVALEVIAIVLFSAATGFDPVTQSPRVAGLLLYLLPVFVLLPVTLLFYVRVWLRTLTLASQSIVREKQTGTWDLLLLTGISPRRLLVGKWWAVVHSMWREYAMLFLMRVALVLFFAIESFRFSLSRNSADWFINAYPYREPLQLPEILLTIAMLALFTVFGACFTAAIGVFGSLLLRRNAPAMALSVLIGILLPLIAGGVLIAIGSFYANIFNYSRHEIIDSWELARLAVPAYTGVSLLDGGALMSSQLAQDAETPERLYRGTPNGSVLFSEYYPYRLYLASLIAALAIYVLLTYGLLRVAEHIARYQGVLPPEGV